MTVKHPAKFSSPLLPVIARYLYGYPLVLDPMAGVGTLARYMEAEGHGNMVVSNELELEWYEQCPHPRTFRDARDLPCADGVFNAIATSPTYGNRMADHHEAKDASRRNTYRHTLGRPLTPGNTGAMQWGQEYRDTHEAIIAECVRVLRPGGRVVWNVKDHIRKGEVVRVTDWHWDTLRDAGLTFIDIHNVECPGNRFGRNGQARFGFETVLVFDKPEAR